MLEESFPNMQSHLDKYNLRLGLDNLPISPAAHYIVGGLDVDRDGRPKLRNKNSPLPNLYAIGEVACTGMHGANRLASNSLLEAVVFAKNTANHIIDNNPKGTKKATPQQIISTLNKLAPNAYFTTDVGQHQMWAAQFIQCKARRWSTSAGLGTMGYGLPALSLIHI